jgi:NH3-dependent NAD+ synthetase
VLGISGGVDSLTAGCLAQRAVEKLRAEGRDATFIAMRLPYGVQKDEAEAQASLAVIKPDRTVTVDIRPAADGMLAALKAGDLKFRDAAHEDFVLGNIKARERMVAQFAVAGAHDGIVIGTDHAAEALMGFFTKFGDGAADITPLTGLNKRRVRAVAAAAGRARRAGLQGADGRPRVAGAGQARRRRLRRHLRADRRLPRRQAGVGRGPRDHSLDAPQERAQARAAGRARCARRTPAAPSAG